MNYNFLSSKLAFLSVLALPWMACSKDDTPATTDQNDTIAVQAAGIYTVNNQFVANTTAESTPKPFYFSLETGKIVDSADKNSDNWDICFNSIYNSTITVNNATLENASIGKGKTAKGQIKLVSFTALENQYYNGAGQGIYSLPTKSMLDSAFSLATSIDTTQWNALGQIGLDYFPGSEPGWAWYDFSGSLFPDKPADEVAHVAYALPRVLEIKTAHGYYAKLIIYSVYQNAPAIPTRQDAAVYLTFKYQFNNTKSNQF